jgi:iron(III) transport system ATP-binding protein
MNFLSIQGLSKLYENNIPALTDFSLEISKGTIWSIVGESGSGKSTLLKIISGLEEQQKGAVYLGGVKIQNPTEKLVAGYNEIQLIHQHNNLYPNSTVEENIGRPLLLFDKEYKKERVEALLELLDLQPFRKKLPRQLSGGQQQKVAIGRALSNEPEILLLDEPFTGLDSQQKRKLIEELRKIFEELQITVLLVTHDIDDAMTMTDRLCIIKKGKLIQQGLAPKIFASPHNAYVAGLFSELNLLPDQAQAYIRPSDILLKKDQKGIRGEVKDSVFLVPYNRLTILLEGSGIHWKVEDKARHYQKGDKIFMGYDESKILRFGPVLIPKD